MVQKTGGRRWGAALCLLMGVVSAGEGIGEEAKDKSQYNLFNPTPRALMREMSTDRPDVTESPYTVDAGHFQIETELFGYIRDADRGERRETYEVAPFLLKVGLLNSVDLQVGLGGWAQERVSANGAATERQGVGDALVRFKVNLWGNDEGKTAFAVMPFMLIRTAQFREDRGGVEPGVAFPFAMKLPGEWDLGAMTEWGLVRNDGRAGYHSEFLNSVTLGHSIIGDLSGYIEFCAIVSTEAGEDWKGTVNAGFTYMIGEDIQLDGGVNVGVTRAADDLFPFVGISWRF